VTSFKRTGTFPIAHGAAAASAAFAKVKKSVQAFKLQQKGDGGINKANCKKSCCVDEDCRDTQWRRRKKGDGQMGAYGAVVCCEELSKRCLLPLGPGRYAPLAVCPFHSRDSAF